MRYSDVMETAIGPLRIEVDEQGRLVALRFDDPEPATGLTPDTGRCAHVARQLREYFDGQRREFDLELALEGSDFARGVWAGLLEIPYGTTTSYGELASRLGSEASARAVGRANGANPVAIVVPCHRVIGADGSLTGYGGGLWRKRALLTLEQARPVQLDIA